MRNAERMVAGREGAFHGVTRDVQILQTGEQRGRHGWSPWPAAGAAAAAAMRGVSLPMPPSQPSRKEWRAVSEHSVRSTGNEELDQMNLVQFEERTIYEHGTGALDVDFCSVTIDGSLNGDVLQQRLHGISRQWKELQHMEIELRAQLIARVEIMEMQKNFDAKIKEHATANAKLKEQRSGSANKVGTIGKGPGLRRPSSDVSPAPEEAVQRSGDEAVATVKSNSSMNPSPSTKPSASACSKLRDWRPKFSKTHDR